MSTNGSKLSPDLIELIELSSSDSPYVSSLVAQNRRRLIERLKESHQIDDEMADYLLE